MANQRPVLQAYQKQEISHIFLGIDFGTSYTKVSYSYAFPNNPRRQHIETLKWDNNDFYKKSVLYYQNKRLYFEKPNENCVEIKYFKYSIIEKKLQNNQQPTKCNFEELCCVYFLAQLIKRALDKIFNSLSISNTNEIKISVNMGVPLENFYKGKNKTNKGLYLEILENAVTLAGGSQIETKIPENQVLLSNLDKVYSEILCKKAKLNWNVNVCPELAAELLLYHESKFVHDGLYAVVDIGGGTVDMALFLKETTTDTHNATMGCVNQTILPYGMEIYKSRNVVNFDNEDLIQNFCKLIMESKRNTKNNKWIKTSEFKKINVFFLGGGSNDSWYTNAIKDSSNRLKSADISLDFSETIKRYIEDEDILVVKEQRLIISQMLARHIDEITNVNGFPDFFNDPVSNEDPSMSNMYDIMYERAKNSGWDDN